MIKDLAEAILNSDKGVKNIEGNPATNEILYSRWEKRYSKTIKDFYEDFIKPRTPDLNILLKWNDLLKWYIEQPGAVYFLRSGNTDGSEHKCRRGWMCALESDTGDKIKYIYDDNDLASYIYKMALDGFCPSQQEFFSFMTEFKEIKDIKWINTASKSLNKVDKTRNYLSFPGHFTQNVKYEYGKNVLLLNGITITCCLGKYNYKYSHIFDVNGTYAINGSLYKSDDIKKKYFSITGGDEVNYKFDTSFKNYCYFRPVLNNSEFDLAKIFLKAHTMRFLNPLNHFLAPHEFCNKYTRTDGTFDLDIAEYVNLLNYIKYVRSIKFGATYKEFANIIRADCAFSDCNKDEIIDIIYHEKSVADSSVFPGYRCSDGYNKRHNNLRAQKKSVKNSSTPAKTQKAISGNGIGQYAKNIFTMLLRNNKLNSNMINNLTDKSYCSKNIGISYLILVSIKTSFNSKDYYKDVVNGEYRICLQWIEKHRVKLEKWRKDNNL